MHKLIKNRPDFSGDEWIAGARSLKGLRKGSDGVFQGKLLPYYFVFIYEIQILRFFKNSYFFT